MLIDWGYSEFRENPELSNSWELPDESDDLAIEWVDPIRVVRRISDAWDKTPCFLFDYDIGVPGAEVVFAVGYCLTGSLRVRHLITNGERFRRVGFSENKRGEGHCYVSLLNAGHEIVPSKSDIREYLDD